MNIFVSYTSESQMDKLFVYTKYTKSVYSYVFKATKILIFYIEESNVKR